MYNLIFKAIKHNFNDKRIFLIHLRFLISIYRLRGIDYLLEELDDYDVSLEDWDAIVDFDYNCRSL